MTESNVKKCPKCNGKMRKGLRLVSYTELTLAEEGEYMGDRITVYCCENCGYVEFYKEMKRAR